MHYAHKLTTSRCALEKRVVLKVLEHGDASDLPDPTSYHFPLMADVSRFPLSMQGTKPYTL